MTFSRPHGRISIARHGRPACGRARLMGHIEFAAWLRTFDGAAIDARLQPPAELLAAADSASLICCSELRRSRESAALVSKGKVVVARNLFNEASIVTPSLPLVRLPPAGWIVLGRALWLLGYGLGVENKPAAVTRASTAARFLIEAAGDGNNVLLLGHGWISRYISAELTRAGWMKTAAHGVGYWCMRDYSNSSLPDPTD